MLSSLRPLVLLILFSHSAAAQSTTNLSAAAAKVDITPTVGIPLAGFGDRVQGSTGIKDPLRAGILVLDDGNTRAAIITLDLINVGAEETKLVRKGVNASTGIPEDHILVAASHTHGGPEFVDSTEYAQRVAEKIALAAADGISRLQPVTIGYEVGQMNTCVNRRLLNGDGIAEMRPNPDGPIDRRVRVLRLDDASGYPSALLVHVACHANVFRNLNTEVTADYPGVVQSLVESAFNSSPVLFLAGAGADIRPNLPSENGFRNGDDMDLKWVGLDIGAAAVQAGARAGGAEALDARPASYTISSSTRKVMLPAKDGGTLDAEIQALRIGKTLFVTMPGEPFVEYALQLEKALPEDLHLFVVGYANGHVGYICTSDSYEYGGYEPGVSHLAPEAERILMRELLAVARGSL